MPTVNLIIGKVFFFVFFFIFFFFIFYFWNGFFSLLYNFWKVFSIEPGDVFQPKRSCTTAKLKKSSSAPEYRFSLYSQFFLLFNLIWAWGRFSSQKSVLPRQNTKSLLQRQSIGFLYPAKKVFSIQIPVFSIQTTVYYISVMIVQYDIQEIINMISVISVSLFIVFNLSG